MDAEGRDIGNLIELTVVAFASMPIELQFGNVTIRAFAAHIANIAEASADIDIIQRQTPLNGLSCNAKERHSIHEVRAVGSLEEAEQHAVCALTGRGGHIADTSDDMRLAQVKTHPSEIIGVGAIVSGSITIESQCRLLLSARGYICACQLSIDRRIVAVSPNH